MAAMQGVILPGNSTVEFREVPVPEPGHGQVLLKMKASSICGSDIRAIYREHLGKGPEAYQNVIAGHEPCGQVAKVGPGCKRLREGDRVVVYHISGCGVCGTCYEALSRVGLSGEDRLLVTGLGPVGLAAAMLGRAMGATVVVGAEIADGRLKLAEQLGLFDHVLDAADSALERIMELTVGTGCETSIDCSGAAAGRHLALSGTRDWGRCVFVGEGGNLDFAVSELLIHKQITLYGSWVTSLKHMEDLLERLDRWGLHPEKTVTHRFGLTDAADAYRIADEGQGGKVCIVFED